MILDNNCSYCDILLFIVFSAIEFNEFPRSKNIFSLFSFKINDDTIADNANGNNDKSKIVNNKIVLILICMLVLFIINSSPFL